MLASRKFKIAYMDHWTALLQMKASTDNQWKGARDAYEAEDISQRPIPSKKSASNQLSPEPA